MASNQIQQTGSFYLSGSFTASLGFDGTASYANKAARTDSTISSGDGIESFAFNGSNPATVALDTSSAHFTTPVNEVTGSSVISGSTSGTTLTLHTGDGSTLATTVASASYALTASYALNAGGDGGTDYDSIIVTVLNYAGQNKYTINGLEAPKLTLSRAGKYRFDLSDATNAGHPLAFRNLDDTPYTGGVTQVGTPGTAGAYTEIVVGFDTPVNIRYYCTVHGNIMGNLTNITDMFALSATGSLQGDLDGLATSSSLAVNNIVTASAVINRITFEKGDGSTFDVFVAQSGSIATASFAESTEFSGILNKPTLVSGSGQISYTGITDIPYLVSESAQITLEDTAFTDGDAFSVLRTDGAGNVAFNFADRAYFNIRAQETLVKGDPIYVSGYSAGQDRVLVSKADASDPAKMPAIGLAAEALGVNANGQGVTVGVLDSTATNTFTAGDELFVANGGGLTATAPTGADEVQTVGIVIRSDATLGRIAVAARMSSATAASATVDTGSLLTTASISGADITFTKGDASTFSITVDTGSSTADSASFSTRVTDLEAFSSSLDATYVTEAELVAATASLSASLTTTDQTISSSVATLSGSASDARNQLAVDYIAADTALSSSASTARDTAALQVSGAFAADSASISTRLTAQEDFSSSLDATFATDAELTALSASLTTTDQTISSSVATLSGSASDARNTLASDYIAADTALSASLTTTDQTISSSVATLSGSASDARNAIVSSISGAFSVPAGTVSSSAQTIANLPAGTVSGSAQVTGSTIITGSVQGNTLTFTKGDGTDFDLLVITSSGGSSDTGSLLTTASVSETTMSFTKGDASTFEVYITASVSASYAQTASLLLGSVESASFATTASHSHTASRAVTASHVDPMTALSGLENFADDEAAIVGGIPLGGLYRNGNFVLIRTTTPYLDDYYLTGWSDANFVSMGGPLSNFLVQNQPWSFGYRLDNVSPTTGPESTLFSTDTGAIAIEMDNATSWYTYMYSNTADGGFDSIASEPTQTAPSYWLWSYNGTTLTIYYNGTQIDTTTADTALPTTGTGNVAFGKSIRTAREPYISTVGVSAFYFANEALASSINTTATANNGNITTDAEYSKVDGFINVGNGTLVDLKGNYSPTVQGSLTFTAK